MDISEICIYEESMKIAFVILNYNTFQETKECILSIENKIDTQDYRIIIVDNQSKDDSADKLEKFIQQREKAVLIRNPENLGFAKGNNAGIAYANKNFKPEYMVVLNSDTELMQDNLVETLDGRFSRIPMRPSLTRKPLTMCSVSGQMSGVTRTAGARPIL